MAAPGITLTFGAQTLRLERFNGAGAQRSYIDTASIQFSVTGSAVQSGSTRPTRKLWTISTVLEKDDAYDILDLYEAWDTERATGAVAVLTLVDEITTRNPGAPITASVVFSDPANIELIGNGSPLYRVSFGLSEV